MLKAMAEDDKKTLEAMLPGGIKIARHTGVRVDRADSDILAREGRQRPDDQGDEGSWLAAKGLKSS